MTNPDRTARALWYVAPGRAELRAAPLPAPGAGEVCVRTLFSVLSRGTERLVFEGRVPASERHAMRAPLQAGDFPFPVKYGYCAVGEIEDGPAELVGAQVFALHPHQDRFVAPVSAVVRLPAGASPARATLAANMETALNALWDSGAGPGDRIAVFGAGAVGLLIAALAGRLPGADVTVVDPDGARAAPARALGVGFSTDATTPRDCDIVFHASASDAGLAAAVAACGLEGRIVEASWYGARATTAPLGGAFHARRLSLVSTQVGHVAPSRRPRWSHRRRLEKALELTRDERLDALLTERIAFGELAGAMPRLLSPGAPGIVTLVCY